MSSSESFVKDIFANFCRTLFKVIGFGLGLVLLFIGIGAFFAGTGEIPHVTHPKVLPNDNWKTRPFSQETPTILRIDIGGVIGMDGVTKDDVRLQLMESIDADLKPGQVKGILLTINTPGGIADQSDSIFRYLKTYKERYSVPIRAHIQGLCASGGMFAACAADKIYATPDSIVGHVGVIFSPPFFNFSGLMTKLGIQSKTLYAGKDKDSMNPFRPWNDHEGEQFQNLINFMYNRFTDVVSASRPKLTKEDLIDQGARLWPAPQALELGYIDGTTNSIEDVLKEFAEELGIYQNYQFVQLEHHDFLKTLFGPNSMLPFGSNKVEHHLRVPGDLPPELCGKPLYLYHPA